jgi:excisionase family DNA binding protein
MSEKLLLDVKEVASLLGCGRTFVYGMIQRGELPVVKLGRLTRIPSHALDDLVSQGLVDSAAPSTCRADPERLRRGWRP